MKESRVMHFLVYNEIWSVHTMIFKSDAIWCGQKDCSLASFQTAFPVLVQLCQWILKQLPGHSSHLSRLVGVFPSLKDVEDDRPLKMCGAEEVLQPSGEWGRSGSPISVFCSWLLPSSVVGLICWYKMKDSHWFQRCLDHIPHILVAFCFP